MELEKQSGGFWSSRLPAMALLVALVSILAFVLLSVSPWIPFRPMWARRPLGAMSPEQVELA